MNKNIIIIAGEALTALAIYYVVGIFMPQTLNYTCPIDGQEYQTTFAMFIAVTYILAAAYSTIMHMLFDWCEKRDLKAYKKEYEKKSISVEEKDSKIIELENKIKTLETALDNVLKRNNG